MIKICGSFISIEICNRNTQFIKTVASGMSSTFEIKKIREVFLKNQAEIGNVKSDAAILTEIIEITYDKILFFSGSIEIF